MIQLHKSPTILTRDECAERAGNLRQEGKVVGYTSGVFDLLHAGHVDYLRRAKEECDVLMVGVNSDRSVRGLKGDLRPVIPEAERAEVVAALRSVDFVFIFDESNNNENVLALRPAKYFKASDYSAKPLSSRVIVEKYGGEVVLVPFKPGLSTSGIIERIVSRFADRVQQQTETLPPPDTAPAIFLDRDGTLIELVEYLHEPSKVAVIPGVLEALKEIRARGYRIVLVTNQPGIGLGYFTKEDLFAVNRELLTRAKAAGLLIDKLYYCPHAESEGCRCRKPGTAMIERAVRELNIDVEGSFMVGDMGVDVDLGKRAGCRTVLVRTGRGSSSEESGVSADIVVDSVADLAAIVPHRPEVHHKTPPRANSLEHVSRFAAKLGHDLNNLLGSMTGCLDLIKSRSAREFPEKNPFERQIRILEAAIRKGSVLTSRMRSFVRPGKLETRAAQLKVSVSRVLELLQLESKIDFNYEFVVAADPVVSMSEFHVSQVVLSLCINAVEAMESLSERVLILYLDEVEIGQNADEALRPGRYAELNIVDHGAGFSTKVKDKLFEPFVTTKGGKVGEGLGLSLTFAREVMQRHGGTVQIQSVEEVGSKVRLLLPIAES